MALQTKKPVTWFKTTKQVREYFDDDRELRLAESMKTDGQLQPVLARADGTLIAGERRLRAAIRAGISELLVTVFDDPLSETQVKVLQLTENLHRDDLKDCEKWHACKELLRLNPGWSNKDLAAHLKLSESTVTKYLSPSRCIRDVQAALESGDIGITAVYEISHAPEDQQGELLRLKLSGTSRDGLAQHIRKQRRDATPHVRVKRISCPLVSGVSIVLSGEELSLDDVIDALAEAHKEAKKARDQNFDVKTFGAVMRDKAKAGG